MDRIYFLKTPWFPPLVNKATLQSRWVSNPDSLSAATNQMVLKDAQESAKLGLRGPLGAPL